MPPHRHTYCPVVEPPRRRSRRDGYAIPVSRGDEDRVADSHFLQSGWSHNAGITFRSGTGARPTIRRRRRTFGKEIILAVAEL